MKNPSFDADKDRWESDRNAGDGPRGPLRSLQTSSPDVILQDLRLRIHRRLIDTLGLSKLSNLEMERVRVEIRRILEDMVMAAAIPWRRGDGGGLGMEVEREGLVLGPLERRLRVPGVSGILGRARGAIS